MSTIAVAWTDPVCVPSVYFMSRIYCRRCTLTINCSDTVFRIKQGPTDRSHREPIGWLGIMSVQMQWQWWWFTFGRGMCCCNGTRWRREDPGPNPFGTGRVGPTQSTVDVVVHQSVPELYSVVHPKVEDVSVCLSI